MIYLIIVSLVWAFSFGLIKTNLAGLDPNFIACCRMILSLALFLPLLRFRRIPTKLAWSLLAVGTIQYGVMYITYIYSFLFLKAYQVALFTIFTPLYVTMISDLLQRRFTPLFLLTTLLAVLGTGVIVFKDIHQEDFRSGFLLVQLSNVCFASGQIFYKRIMGENTELKDFHVFGLLYLGAFLVTLFSTSISMGWKIPSLNPQQVLTLLYLGIIASGVCFFLWNVGARKTNTGFLAVANNLKVPLAVACSMIFFHEKGNILRLVLGGAIIVAALLINELLLRKSPIYTSDTGP